MVDYMKKEKFTYNEFRNKIQKAVGHNTLLQ